MQHQHYHSKRAAVVRSKQTTRSPTFSILYSDSAFDATSTASCCIWSDISAFFITALRCSLMVSKESGGQSKARESLSGVESTRFVAPSRFGPQWFVLAGNRVMWIQCRKLSCSLFIKTSRCSDLQKYESLDAFVVQQFEQECRRQSSNGRELHPMVWRRLLKKAFQMRRSFFIFHFECQQLDFAISNY